MAILITILAVLFLLVMGNIVLNFLNKRLLKKLSAKNSKLFLKVLHSKGLQPNHILFTDFNGSKNCLCLDEAQKKISFGSITDGKILTTEYPFDKIVSYKIKIEDENQREISTGGAAIGALVGGGIGAMVGNLLGSQDKRIRGIYLLITVNYMEQPHLRIPILKAPKGLEGSSKEVQEAAKKAELWSSLFNIILKNQKRPKLH